MLEGTTPPGFMPNATSMTGVTVLWNPKAHFWIWKVIAYIRWVRRNKCNITSLRKQLYKIRLPLACSSWPIFSSVCTTVSLPPSIQTAPRVQTFWWCFCRWQEPSCSLAWQLCLSGNCWSPSTTDESLPNLRKNVLVPSGTRSVNIARGGMCL